MKIGEREFNCGTYVMSIVNLTPDSFYAGSRADNNSVFKKIEEHILEGADIIDIGAQSTRPGFKEVTAQEEIKRLKVLKEIKKEFNIPISIDTDKADVAEFVLDVGADMINDIWGLSRDEKMAKLIGSYGAAVCIMHNQTSNVYNDILSDIDAFFEKAILRAKNNGIADDKICLDGGIGFAKDREQNYFVLNNYEHFLKHGYPLLLGTSRKSMFGGNIEDRLKPTLETTLLAVNKGVRFVRVHDTLENKETIKRGYVYTN